jgi:hypothetical protein
MAEPSGYDRRETQTIAERVLSAAFEGDVRLGGGEALKERTHVSRFAVLDGPPSAPASVIVKRARLWEGETYNPDSTQPYSPAWRLFNDWAGLQFLTRVAGAESVAPRFYGGDRAAGLFVMEDLGAGASPDQALLGDDPATAEVSLIELAAMLGRMHAATVGKQAQLAQLRAALGPHVPGNEDNGWLADGFYATVAALDVPLRPGAGADLEALIAALTDPSPFLAYTHGDPCPDNWVQAGGRLRLFDFEAGAFRHAFTDGVYGRFHFPTCWCVNRMPDPIPLRMESVYRDELVRGCPAAADDGQYQHAVVEGCAYWLLQMCSRRWGILDLLEKDREWGIATVRQRVLLRIPILEQTAEEAGYLTALGATFADIAAQLRARWPTDADAMPYYPAFRTSGSAGS